MTTSTEKLVTEKLEAFIDEHYGKTVGDTYGAQSPALGEAWVEHLTGTPFRANARAADEWWTSNELADRGFVRVARDDVGLAGDLAVWDGTFMSAGAPGIGTLGLVHDRPVDADVKRLYVFTQGPRVAATRLFDRGGLLGYWRYRFTPEQIDAGLKRLLADVNPEDPLGPIMTDAEVDEAMRGLPDLKTFAEPGDVAVISKGSLLGFTRPAGTSITQDFGPAPEPVLAPGAWLAARDGAATWHPSPPEGVSGHVSVEAFECSREWARYVDGIEERADRRTRLGWAWACLVEAGEQVAEAFSLLVTIWRRYE